MSAERNALLFSAIPYSAVPLERSSISQPHVPRETKGRSKTIAVVAAAWHLRSLVRAALANKRTSVVEASSLEELRAIAPKERIDLVILDTDIARESTAMPYEELKRESAFTEVPVILLINGASPNETSPLDVHPSDRTLHRHFSPFELLNLVYALTGY